MPRIFAPKNVLPFLSFCLSRGQHVTFGMEVKASLTSPHSNALFRTLNAVHVNEEYFNSKKIEELACWPTFQHSRTGQKMIIRLRPLRFEVNFFRRTRGSWVVASMEHLSRPILWSSFVIEVEAWPFHRDRPTSPTLLTFPFWLFKKPIFDHRRHLFKTDITSQETILCTNSSHKFL